MDRREVVYRTIEGCGIMPTVFVYDLDETIALAKTLFDNGIHLIELLQRTPLALDAIRVVKEAVPEMLVGAGTVLDVTKAEEVYEKGADYIVSPYYHQEIIDWCNEHQLATVPGCATISEISRGYDSGLRYFKLFPANQLGGMDFIRQISEIYADARYVPAGGITMDQVASYSKSRYVGALGSVCMMPQELISAHKWEEIAALTRKTIALSLGLDFIGAPKKSDTSLTTAVETYAQYQNWDTEIPKAFQEACPDADGIFYTNSVERALYYFNKNGLTGKVLVEADPTCAAVGLIEDSARGQKWLLIARHSVTRI